ncbi:unnamed protein product [Mesocestoides corti]|uniref:Tyrosine specific protein phosphatases domain-containing protein n=1 Tax=Mesocestoides corti TaxID=53468 RepID=A0A3P6I226_MESCO|nr:unnamed protein product [Mesocestoides corti]
MRGTWLLPVKLPIPKVPVFIPVNTVLRKNLFIYQGTYGLPTMTFLIFVPISVTLFLLFTRRGVKYAKIFVEGHAIPSASTVKRFCEVVDEFTDDCPGKLSFLIILMFFVQSLTKSNVFADDMIAIHCTHGVNRTGYLICRYLIDVLGWSANEAISEFELARGYPIERDNYLEDLRRC